MKIAKTAAISFAVFISLTACETTSMYDVGQARPFKNETIAFIAPEKWSVQSPNHEDYYFRLSDVSDKLSKSTANFARNAICQLRTHSTKSSQPTPENKGETLDQHITAFIPDSLFSSDQPKAYLEARLVNQKDQENARSITLKVPGTRTTTTTRTERALRKKSSWTSQSEIKLDWTFQSEYFQAQDGYGIMSCSYHPSSKQFVEPLFKQVGSSLRFTSKT